MLNAIAKVIIYCGFCGFWSIVGWIIAFLIISKYENERPRFTESEKEIQRAIKKVTGLVALVVGVISFFVLLLLRDSN